MRPPGGGGAKSPAGQPLDPRTEGSNGDTNGNGKGDTNGKAKGVGSLGGRLAAQAKKQAARNSRKSAGIGTADVARTHTPPTSVEEGAAVRQAPVLVASAPTGQHLTTDSPPVDVARLPLLLPPIVPAESGFEPETTPGRALAPEPTSLVPGARPADGLDTANLLVPAPEFTDTDGTDGLPSLARPKKPMRALLTPVVVPRRRPRVRRVTRVVRHVDTWSVFKVAVVFNFFLYGVCLTAGVLLWQVAQNTGTVDNIERFFESFGWEQFQLNGGAIFHNSWIAGLFVVVGMTGLAVLMATLFNLITDLVGGIRVSVLEEEVVAREERGLGWRRALRRQPEPAEGPTTETAAGPESV